MSLYQPYQISADGESDEMYVLLLVTAGKENMFYEDHAEQGDKTEIMRMVHNIVLRVLDPHLFLGQCLSCIKYFTVYSYTHWYYKHWYYKYWYYKYWYYKYWYYKYWYYKYWYYKYWYYKYWYYKYWYYTYWYYTYWYYTYWIHVCYM